MNKPDTWETKFRRAYTNIIDEDSLKDVIEYMRFLLRSHDAELEEKIEKMKHREKYMAEGAEGYNQALSDIQFLLKEGGK